ncbi:Sfi1 spindle body protein-domain-containing protein [Phyllosticta citrichinensis]|uniref:Sfi1 spindle body protein-domain-containing protein n=1 Tax=Phyllosticta citrichinensis TaxID=1130410 RepID=A0ABR1XL48_9PEZI
MPASIAEELPHLSNQDVEILYTIVTTAEKLPGPPYRALFAAYDKVLAERGINPNHDRVYFRFLLRMRGASPQMQPQLQTRPHGEFQTGSALGHDDPTSTETLYGRFTTLLGDMGIQLEVDEQGEGVEEVNRRFDEHDLDDLGGEVEEEEEEEEASASYGQAMPTPRSRRASFNDSNYDRTRDLGPWDDEDENGFVPGRGHQGLSAPPRRPRSSSQLLDPSTWRRGRARSSSRDSRAAMHSALPYRGRLSSRAPSEVRHTRRRARSVSSQGSIRITRTEEIQRQQPNSLSFEDLDDFGSPRRRSSIGGPRPESPHYVPPEMLYRPSLAQMVADAETFSYARSLFAARRVMHTWRDKAIEQRDLHMEMGEAADRFNKRKLMEAALEMFKLQHNAKRQQKETERFFEHLERRAEKARNLFVLTKAFTHWANSAADEVMRTQVARRHILRFKYFNAWHEITAVEELKVRRHVLAKFFAIWRRRYTALQEERDVALAFRSENVIQQAYSACFWEFSERRAAKRYDATLKRKAFATLIDRLLQVKEKEAEVQAKREMDLKRKSLQILSNKVMSVQSLGPAAEDLRNKRLLSLGFNSIKVQAKLNPIERELVQKVDIGLARRALTTLRVRAEQSRKAAQLNQLLVLRNAFTAWNDQLRCQALAQRIDDRMIVQALYKWSLATRGSILSRLQETKLKGSMFRNWANKTGDKSNRLAASERILRESEEMRLKRKAFGVLREKLQEQRQCESQALSMYAPRVVSRCWTALKTKHQQVRELEVWGTDAQFYTLTTHALKKWRESTHQSQRMRKREVYATVRRRTKLGIARRAFETWRAKAAHVEMAQRQAHEMRENAVLRLATHCLQFWHEKAISFEQQDKEAERIRRMRLLSGAYGALFSKLQKVSNDQDRAAAFLDAQVAAAAVECLKKMNWRLFQVRTQQRSGEALAERNFERHAKSMIKHWAARARQSREARGLTLAESVVDEGEQEIETSQRRTTDGSTVPDEEQNNGGRNDDWTAFDPSALDLGDVKLSLNFNTAPTFAASRPLFSRNSSPTRPVQNEPPAEPEQEPPNPFALTINPGGAPNPNILTSTPAPLPGYLRTPSKRSTIRARRIAALSSTVPTNTNTNSNNTATNTATITAPTAFSSSTRTFVLPGAGPAQSYTGSTTPAAAPPLPYQFARSTTLFPTDPIAGPSFIAPGTAPPPGRATAPAPPYGVTPAGFPVQASGARLKTAITPFARKLTQGGYPASGGSGTRSVVGRRRFGGGNGSGSVTGAAWGFEDIAEDDHAGVGGGKEKGKEAERGA